VNNIPVEVLLALIVMQQEDKGGTFLSKEEMERSLTGLNIGMDWDEERNGLVLFMIEEENIDYDDEG